MDERIRACGEQKLPLKGGRQRRKNGNIESHEKTSSSAHLFCVLSQPLLRPACDEGASMLCCATASAKTCREPGETRQPCADGQKNQWPTRFTNYHQGNRRSATEEIQHDHHEIERGE